MEERKLNLLEYNSKKQVNIIPKESYEELVYEVFSTVAEILSKSYGPLGSNSIISQGRWNSTTKDGFTIFKNIVFNNKFKTMVFEQMRATCTKLNNTVGDGTTTSILFTDELFKSYKKFKPTIDSMYLLPREFTKAWDEVIEEIIEKIKKQATIINTKDKYEVRDIIYDISMIASNGNKEISNTVADVYLETDAPLIRYKNSPTNKCFMTSIKGFEFPSNLIDDCFCKTEDLSVELMNTKVLLFSIKIEPNIFEKIIKEINEVFRSRNQKLIVVAPAYDELMSKTSMIDYTKQEWNQNKSFNFYPTQYLFGKTADNQLDDLSVILGCNIINSEMVKKILDAKNEEGCDLYDLFVNDQFNIIGTANRATLSIYNGIVFNEIDINNEKYIDLLNKVEHDLENLYNQTDNDAKDYSFEITQLKERISRLRMNNYIYYIGSNSRLETGLLSDTIDDVIKAAASAYKYGIIPGSQISIMQICNKMYNYYIINDDFIDNIKFIIIQMIKESIENLYKSLLNGPNKNGFDRMRYKLKSNKSDEDFFDYITSNNLYDEENGYHIFNIDTLTFDNDVIVSAETDINVLIAASELIKLLISGNQFIFRETGFDNDEMIDVQ